VPLFVGQSKFNLGKCRRSSNDGTRTSVIGLNSVKLDKYTVIASYTLVADGVYCDCDPIKKKAKANIGSNLLERD
jgi:hypothetical protein